MKLTELIKTGEGEKQPVKMLLYGQNKIGKTTFAAESPAPLFIPVEDGLRAFPGIARLPQPKELSTFVGYIGSLIQAETIEHKTIVIDSLDWLEKLIHADICERKSKESIGDISHGAGYAEATKMMNGVLKGLDAVVAKHGVNVIFIAHEKIIEIVCPINGVYTNISVNCSDKFAGQVFDWADFNGYCHKELRLTKDSHGIDAESKRVIMESDHIISFEKTAKFKAGARVPRNSQFPLVMPLDANTFWSAVDSDYIPF